MRIERIYHRQSPILAGAPPLRPIGWSNITTYVHLWEHLERAGVTDVPGVWGFYNGLLTLVALRQRYAGHAKQALITAAGFRHGDVREEASRLRTRLVAFFSILLATTRA